MFLFCKAHEQLGDPAYLAAAERSGEAVWQRGLLKKARGQLPGREAPSHGITTGDPRGQALRCGGKRLPRSHGVRLSSALQGPGACHGVSGSAYALLRLYRSCPPGPGRDKWLHRAQQFALFMDT